MRVPSLADYEAYSCRREAIAEGDRPIVSIVTVSLNAAATIERTIDSVQAQSFPSIEQIFVDGSSTDATAEIVRRRLRPQDLWISEPDRGISDAFNKGVALARGRYLKILNADDWLSRDQIACGVSVLDESGADFVFGDLVFYRSGKPIFTYVGDRLYAKAIHRRLPAISHPTVVARRACFERIGLFDLQYRNAMDYDWLLRLHRAGGCGVYSPQIVGHMTHDGISNRDFARTIDEVRRVAVAHGRHPVLAALEARGRRAKTALSLGVQQHAKPLYELTRRAINPSYRPLRADR